ncbi:MULTISPECIES: nucleoside phosphorylase [Alcaligenes]|uniref:5'-methylthioadenosine/S-adenosylhomocysteine nucleosidase family protein n=1 Tax=Alcaligenes TaxID=507 RepID=UPI000E81AD1E|nr:nucleoside phosphorylase [Alcaligenes faecalis]HBQ88365.1 nucleoside phosphorylase [Alcaligenes faecalis]
MKIMLIEDDDRKRRAIVAHLKKKFIPSESIIFAKNMTDFSASLHEDIGLFIIDFNLPSVENAAASQNGRAILEAIVKAGKSDALTLAISSYPNDFPELRAYYEERGCILADFNSKGWQSTLDHILVQLRRNWQFDFLVFCALPEERNPYIGLLDGKSVSRGGIDCYDVQLAERRGSIILLPQMGLVNAAITAGVCIDKFKPKVIGMSGICGGFERRAELGQIFICGMAYEYQSGKWATDGFKQEPYQVSTDQQTLTRLRHLADKTGLMAELEQGFSGQRPGRTHKPEVGIFTSGSAVIADKSHLNHIENIHRKINALDMEVFAVQRAAELSAHRPPSISAKCVVDLCDSNKSDNLHAYGCHVSAKFLILAITEHFATP